MNKIKEVCYLTDREITTTKEISAISQLQLVQINTPTPDDEIVLKQDGDTVYKSVKGSYIKKRLNIIFGWNWDFQIISKEYVSGSRQAIVHGRLTVRNGQHAIIKEQFGKHNVTTLTATSGSRTVSYPSDIGNAYKSASTDALKKCASELGICWDIYTQEAPEENKGLPEETHDEKAITIRLEHFLKLATSEEALDDVVERFKNSNELTEVHKLLIESYKLKIKK